MVNPLEKVDLEPVFFNSDISVFVLALEEFIFCDWLKTFEKHR